MCGIAGIFDLEARRDIDRRILESMNESQTHRGPNGSGYHTEPGVGFGHRRLSIIDIAGGKQPIYNEDDTVVLTYNGEIYNFETLTKELVEKGHRFKTHSDSEVIVHAWEEWGEHCVERFNGMFAFAIWDRNQHTLFLARDRLGIKPLYYGVSDDQHLLFSSELKAIACHPKLSRTIHPHAVEEYFSFGYVPDPKTIYRSVLKLPPGHTLTIRRGDRVPEPRQYWDVPFALNERKALPDLQEELVNRLSDCVRRRLIAEVPLGAFLSGGVDSSAVVALMADIIDEPVNTCSISFGDPEFNESPYADQVAQQFNTNHRVEQVDPEDFSLVDQLVGLYDEPYADSSAIPTFRVCELAKKNVTVALSGDGGDENFAGYRRYRWHAFEERVRSLLPAPMRRPVFGFLGAAYPKLDWAPKVLRGKSTFQALARDSLEGYFQSVSILPGGFRENLFSDDFKRELHGYEGLDVFRKFAAQAPPMDTLSLAQYLDFKTYLPGDILTKVDRASMAQGLEVRVPILDHTFVEWVSSLPPSAKLHGREGKYLFKKSLESKLPNNILYRSKMGFAVPLASWFRGPLKHRVRDALLGSTLRDSGIFSMQFLENVVRQHESGVRDFSAPIWALLMFEGFERKLGATGPGNQASSEI